MKSKKFEDKPVLGFCDNHKSEPVACVYTGPETEGKKVKLCKDCWRDYRRKVLKLTDCKFVKYR